jgi:hypothetical protein
MLLVGNCEIKIMSIEESLQISSGSSLNYTKEDLKSKMIRIHEIQDNDDNISHVKELKKLKQDNKFSRVDPIFHRIIRDERTNG